MSGTTDVSEKRTIDRLRSVKPHTAAGILLLLILASIAYSLIPDGERGSGEVPAAQAEEPAAVAEAPAEPDAAESAAGREGVATDEQPGGSWTGLALALMAVATTVSVAVSFYLYRWRRLLLANPNTVVPEKWHGALIAVSRQVESLGDAYKTGVDALNRASTETRDKMGQLTETFMALHKALDQRDSEIARLKRGYDAEVFRRFLTRFIRVDQAIDDFVEEEQPASDSLRELKRMLEDAFNECEVEIFAPQVGEDYRTAFGVADNPEHVDTTDPEKQLQIVEVLSPGYRLRDDVIVQAKVSVFKTGS